MAMDNQARLLAALSEMSLAELRLMLLFTELLTEWLAEGDLTRGGNSVTL